MFLNNSVFLIMTIKLSQTPYVDILMKNLSVKNECDVLLEVTQDSDF